MTQLRRREDGRIHRRVTEVVMPALRVVPNPRIAKFGKVESIGWVLSIDDTHFRIYVAGRVTERGELARFRSKMAGKHWWELTEEEHQRYTGDYEAQTGQGPITYHSEEHFATSDKGVALLRRFLEQQPEIVAAGGDPPASPSPSPRRSSASRPVTRFSTPSRSPEAGRAPLRTRNPPT